MKNVFFCIVFVSSTGLNAAYQNLSNASTDVSSCDAQAINSPQSNSMTLSQDSTQNSPRGSIHQNSPDSRESFHSQNSENANYCYCCNCCKEMWKDNSCRCAIGTFAAFAGFLCGGAIWQLAKSSSSCSNAVAVDADVTNSCWILSGIQCGANTDITFQGPPFPGITSGSLLTAYLSGMMNQYGYDQSDACVQLIDCGNLNCSPNYNQTTQSICFSALKACDAQPNNSTTAKTTNLRKRLAAKLATKKVMD